MSYFTVLECSKFRQKHDANEVQTVCKACGKPQCGGTGGSFQLRAPITRSPRVKGDSDNSSGSGLKYTDLFEVNAPVFDVGEKINYRSL